MAGQTLSQVRALLDAAGLSPLHRFGQNFLIDLNLLRNFVAAADLRPADVVLEVGPGTGSLTEVLLESGARVIAVEIDHGFQDMLEQRLGANPRFTLLRGDALAGKNDLHPDLGELLRRIRPEAGGAFKLVANLPYQIATPLLVLLLQHDPQPAALHATIQWEVAERLRAAAGAAAYGPLSVVAQSLAAVEVIARVPPAAFWPRPDVDSAMVRLLPWPADQAPAPLPFAAFVQRGFAQRRKMLRRLLREGDGRAWAAAFAEVGVSPDARPESLPPEAWRRLFAAWRVAASAS